MSRFAAPIAESIWDMKYRLKDGDGTVHDRTVEDTWRRVARALAGNEAVQYLPLALGEPFEPPQGIVPVLVPAPDLAAQGQRRPHGGDDPLVLERLLNEVYGPGFDVLDGHRHV